MPRLNGDPGGTRPASTAAKFALGKTLITKNALETLNAGDVLMALERHVTGDWGDDLCPEDRASNERALQQSGRLVSVYRTRDGVKFYVITEADRSVTTVLLPEDY